MGSPRVYQQAGTRGPFDWFHNYRFLAKQAGFMYTGSPWSPYGLDGSWVERTVVSAPDEAAEIVLPPLGAQSMSEQAFADYSAGGSPDLRMDAIPRSAARGSAASDVGTSVSVVSGTIPRPTRRRRASTALWARRRGLAPL